MSESLEDWSLVFDSADTMDAFQVPAVPIQARPSLPLCHCRHELRASDSFSISGFIIGQRHTGILRVTDLQSLSSLPRLQQFPLDSIRIQLGETPLQLPDVSLPVMRSWEAIGWEPPAEASQPLALVPMESGTLTKLSQWPGPSRLPSSRNQHMQSPDFGFQAHHNGCARFGMTS